MKNVRWATIVVVMTIVFLATCTATARGTNGGWVVGDPSVPHQCEMGGTIMTDGRTYPVQSFIVLWSFTSNGHWGEGPYQVQLCRNVSKTELEEALGLTGKFKQFETATLFPARERYGEGEVVTIVEAVTIKGFGWDKKNPPELIH